MSLRPTKSDRNTLTVRPAIAAKIKAICAAHPDGCSWSDFCNEVLDTFLLEHRSGKVLVLPEERFTERKSEDAMEMICW